MIRYECDRCGARLDRDDGNRFIVKIEVYAAAPPLDLDIRKPKDVTSALNEVIKSLKDADPSDIEDRTYRCLRFDLCDPCRKLILSDPFSLSESKD